MRLRDFRKEYQFYRLIGFGRRGAIRHAWNLVTH